MIAFLLAFASITVSPATSAVTLKAAQAGDTLVLTGAFPTISIGNRTFEPPLTIDARQAKVAGVVISKTSGVIWQGGTITAGPNGYAMKVTFSRSLTISGATFTEAVRGIVLDRSSDFAVTGSLFTGLRTDGIDMAGSQRGLVEGNQFRDMRPIKATYDAAGKLLKDGDHPDAIQIWPEAGYIPSDIKIRFNHVYGDMQGIFGDGTDKTGAGFDRIAVYRNTVISNAGNGIVLTLARDSEVRDNYVQSIPGSVLPNNGRAVKTNLRLIGDRSVACGNIVPDVKTNPTTQPC